MNIWNTLSSPITVLAPMEDVTDTVFRQIILRTGRPQLFFTEFTNIDGLLSPLGSEKVAQRLKFIPEEKPLIAQIWGNDPEKFRQAAEKIVQMGFNGIDINMGCPVKDVVKQGAGGGCIGRTDHVKEILQATREGAGDLPVTIKTRLGNKTIQTESWIRFLLEQHLPALTMHLRTIAEQSAVPAHWDEMTKIVEMRNKISPTTKIIGNGDVMSLSEIREKVATYGCDGIMIGRGIFHDPWLYSEEKDKSLSDRLTLLKEHVELFDKTWQGQKPFQVLKKYFKIYLNGFDGASKLREQFMLTQSSDAAIKLVEEILH